MRALVLLAVFTLCAAPIASNRGLDEAQFNEVLDAIASVYGPVFARRGLELVIERRWGDDTINSAPFNTSTFAGFAICGGLARARAMTQDGLALVACHELGHLLGGFPQARAGMANEGQSDYFATAKCLRRLFADPSTRSFTRIRGPDPTAEKACAAAFPGPDERAICIRSAMAALSASPATTDWTDDAHPPSFATPDPYRTTVTDDRHMPRQCRLDTLFQGALCAKSPSEEFSDTDPDPGACTHSQGFKIGVRPRCWYQPPELSPRSH